MGSGAQGPAFWNPRGRQARTRGEPRHSHPTTRSQALQEWRSLVFPRSAGQPSAQCPGGGEERFPEEGGGWGLNPEPALPAQPSSLIAIND